MYIAAMMLVSSARQRVVAGLPSVVWEYNVNGAPKSHVLVATLVAEL
jgi:hypothetical protein